MNKTPRDNIKNPMDFKPKGLILKTQGSDKHKGLIVNPKVLILNYRNINPKINKPT